MRRRRFLRRTGAGIAGVTALAGCTSDGDSGTDGTENGTDETAGSPTGTVTGTDAEETLRVATYSSFTGEETAGEWLKSAFESERSNVTVEFTTPENGLNQYVQRRQQGVDLEADLYVGLNTGELVTADENLDTELFQPVESELAGADSVKDGLQIDPEGRAIPYDTGYISLVYDEGEVSNPETFDALTTPEYEDGLIAQNAQQSDPGRAFLLWTIHEKGPDAYLDYWEQLVDNGVTIMEDWEPAYNAYTSGEAPMVVSYSTDQVYYHPPDYDLSKHQVGFLNDQGYANPEAMAQFQGANDPELARSFMEFVLTDEAQAEIATRNVQFPAVEGVDPGGDFSEYALEPPEPVTFTYEELQGNVTTWIDDWARQIASN